MANPEHLVKLKEGVEVWNQWRQQNPDIRPNFHSGDLTGIDLSTVVPGSSMVEKGQDLASRLRSE